MNMWNILDIEPTTDKRTIKRAYAKMAARYHPEEQPEKFQQVYDAYEQALFYAERYANTQYFQQGAAYDDILDENSASASQNTSLQLSDSIDFDRKIPETSREEPVMQDNLMDYTIDFDGTIPRTPRQQFIPKDNSGDNAIDFDEIIPKAPRQKLTLKGDVREDKEIDFEQLVPNIDRGERRLSLTHPVEPTINFESIVKNEDTDEPQYDKEPQLYQQKDKKSERNIPKFIVGIFVWLFLWGILHIATDGNIHFFSDLQDSPSGQERVKRTLERRYDTQFEITSIEIPDNLNGVYYLVEDGRKKEDYEWFECSPVGVSVPVSFLAALDDSGAINYDYSYKQLFAFIFHVGLGGYLDMEDIQQNNLQYLNNGERKYCYPIIKLSSGNINNDFFQRLTELSDMIQESDAQFYDNKRITINIKNSNTGGIYHFRLRKGKKQDMQNAEQEIRVFFGV